MEWKEVTLSELGTIVGGATPSTKITSFYDGNIPWLTPKDLSVNDNKYIFRGERNITEEGFKSCSCKMLPKGSILFSSRAPIGYVAIAANDMCTNQGFKSVIPNDETDSEFLYYLLKYNKNNIASQGSGTTFAEVSGKTMKEIEVVVPKEKDDQRRIASILSSLDRKIELNNKINADLEEMAQAIFKNWFVDFEPFKDGKFVDSELGMIPEGWKVGTLDEIFSLKYGKNLSTSMILEKGDYPVYGANGIIGYYNEFNCDKYSVLVTSRGNGSGDVSRTHHPQSFITNNSFVVEPLEHYKYIKLPFINGLFNIIDFKSYCSGSAQPQLTNKAMRNICIISPPRELVIKYCEILETLFSHIECVIDENSRLSLLRDTLLSRLMSGEIEVPE